MKTYSYLDFIELFQINDRHKAQDKWFEFKVEKSGVTLIPQDELLTPMREDLFSLEELDGRGEELHWYPQVELREQKKNPPPAPEKVLPPSKKNIEFIKKRIEQGNEGIIIPPSPPMLPNWAKGLGDLSQPLLTFPCSDEDLRYFIKLTHLGFMLPPDHELLQPTGIEPTSATKTESQDSAASLEAVASNTHNEKHRGWDEIIEAWCKHGQKKVSKRQMRNHANQGLKVADEDKAGKKIPTCTDQDMLNFISERARKKAQASSERARKKAQAIPH